MTLNNLDIVITGTLSRMTRKTAFDRIRSEGGFPRKKISGNTDLLVVGQLSWMSEKLSFALDNFIDIITENDFYDLIGEAYEKDM